jgi:hypothetical protein
MHDQEFEPVTEVELTGHIVAWLEGWGWDVYQEVQIFHRSSVADIVAVQGPIFMVVEVKKVLSLAVLAQANNWANWWRNAHYTWVAVPKSEKSTKARKLAWEICRDKDIGLLELGCSHRITVQIDAKLKRGADTEDWKLYNSHIISAPKWSRAGWPTPFHMVRAILIDMVRGNPGIPLNEAIRKIGSYRVFYSNYSSVRGALRTWLEEGKMLGVELRREGKRLLLWPAERVVQSAGPREENNDVRAGGQRTLGL